MKDRLVRVAKWIAFPAFYLFCLAMFGYLTFPYGRLKDRLLVEFEKHGKPGQRIEIGKLSSYWLSGVELTNVKLHMPPDEPAAAFPGSADFGAAAAAPAKENGITSAESQDLPNTPHGRRYNERTTKVKIHKIGMLALAKTLEKIEQSGYPVAITRLNLKPRSGEPDSFEVDLAVSAFDREPDAEVRPGGASSASPSASASSDKGDL